MPTQRLGWRWRLLAAIVVGFVRIVRWRIDVQGLEHVPRQGGAVLAFNHHSYLDFLMVAWPIVRTLRRRVRFLAKQELWNSRAVRWVVRWGDAVPVDRGSDRGRASALDAAIAALHDGALVAVAPEQTISRSLELLPLRSGAVRMAAAAGVPIVPVVGWGTQRVMTLRTRFHPRPGLPVTVRFAEPLWVAPDADPREATAQLERRLTQVLEEVRTTYPDGAPAGAPWVPASMGGGAPPHEEVLRTHGQGWASKDTGGQSDPTPPHDEDGWDPVQDDVEPQQ